MSKINFKRWFTYSMIALIGLFLAMISVKLLQEREQLFLRLHYTAEVTYFDAKISDHELQYTHLNKEKTEERCRQWIQQRPCWTEDDLVTEKTLLTDEEWQRLKELAHSTGVTELEKYYGPEQGVRCYGQTLFIQEKRVTYCHHPDGPKAPFYFLVLSEEIETLVKEKFIE